MTPAKRFRVVIATDGSAAAKAAIAMALRFPWPDVTQVFGVVAKQVRADYRRSILLAALDRTAEFVATSAGRAMSRRWPDAEVRVVDAPPVDAIVKEATRRRADVIVMGWRGHGAIRRLLMGSVSRGVVRRDPCAVLVVRRARRDVRRVVIGFDSSAHARRAVAFVASLNPPRGGRVSLFTAVDTMRAPLQALVPPDTRAAAVTEVTRINRKRLASAHQALDRATRALTRAGWKVDRIVTTGAPLRDLLASVTTSAPILLLSVRKEYRDFGAYCLGVSPKARSITAPYRCSSCAELSQIGLM